MQHTIDLLGTTVSVHWSIQNAEKLLINQDKATKRNQIMRIVNTKSRFQISVCFWMTSYSRQRKRVRLFVEIHAEHRKTTSTKTTNLVHLLQYCDKLFGQRPLPIMDDIGHVCNKF